MELAAVRQHLAALSCSLAVAMTGVAFVWFAPLMLCVVSPESPVPMTTAQTSWLVSSIELSCLLSVLPAGILCDRVGRKKLTLFTGPICALTYVVMIYVRSVPAIFVLRLIHGICLAVAYTSGPIYIAEISEPTRRGSTSCHVQTMWYLGSLYAYCVGPYVSYGAYAAASVAVPMLFTATFASMPESPYYLLMRERKEEAERALSWFRGGKAVDEEFKSIQETVKREFTGKGSWKDLFLTKKDIKAFVIVQLCCFTKYMGGMSAFIIYVSQTFGESTTGYLDHHLLTIITGVLLTVATFSSCLIADRIGRRPMLIYSSICCFAFHLIAGGYYFMDSSSDMDMAPYVWALYASVAGFVIATSVGLSPLMQTIQAEYFSSGTRGIGGGLTLVFGSTFTFLSIKLYQFVQDTAGVYLNYWVYALVSLFGAVSMYFFLPETAGRSLGQIQKDMSQ